MIYNGLMKKLILLTTVALSAVLMIGCSQSTIVTILQDAVDAAQVAFPLLAAEAGLDPALVAQTTKYLQDVNQGIAAAVPILASSATPAEKAAEIAAEFANIAEPDFPAGTPQIIVSAIDLVAQDVAKFLTSIATAKTVAAKTPKAKTDFSAGDVRRLAMIQLKAEANLRAIAVRRARRR